MKEARHKCSHILQSHSYEIFRLGKSIETEGRLVVVRVWGKGKMESDSLMRTRFSFGVMKIYLRFIETVVTQHCECTKY